VAGGSNALALADEGPFDLVLAGGERARFAAATLGLPDAGRAERLDVCAVGETANITLHGPGGAPVRSQALPAVIGIEPGLVLREYTVAGHLAGLSRSVEVRATVGA